MAPIEKNVARTCGEKQVQTDVIIVGAGISGLSAAKLLAESGLNVSVLEARDRVGGRTYTVKEGEFGWVDLGASYISPKQTYIGKLIKELGLKPYKVFNQLRGVHISKEKREVYETQWPTFNWRDAEACEELKAVIQMMDAMMQQVSKEEPWSSPHAKEWDSITLKDFFDEQCTTREAREFLLAFCQSNVSADPSQISLLWYLWYNYSAGGSCDVIWNVTDGGQEFKLHGGAMQISEKIAQRLGDKVKLNKAVYNVDQKGGKVTVGTTDGSQYEGRYVIMATPLPLLQKIHYNPPLPAAKNQLIQRVTMGTTIKCEIFYKTAFWRSKGLSGFVTSGDGINVVCNSIDDCKPGSKYAQITCFVCSDKAIEMLALKREERCQTIASFLAKGFDTDEALHPVHYVDQNWACEQYTGGCYTATYPTSVMSKYGRTLREPFGLMHFAGTETATEWSGYMNGAVQAGERAAKEILSSIGAKKDRGLVKDSNQIRSQIMWQVTANDDGVSVRAPAVESSLQAMKPKLAWKASSKEVVRESVSRTCSDDPVSRREPALTAITFPANGRSKLSSCSTTGSLTTMRPETARSPQEGLKCRGQTNHVYNNGHLFLIIPFITS